MKHNYKQDLLIFGLLVIIISLYFLPYLTMYQSRDEGNWVYGVERFYQGEIVYRDFFEYIFPGVYFLLVTLYSIFGLKFIVVRGLVLVVDICAGFLIYLLSKRLKDSWWFSLLCLLFYMSMILPWWNFLAHHILSVTASLLTIYLFCRFIETGEKRIYLFLCGLSSALVAFFTQSVGFYVVLAGNIFLVLHNILRVKYETNVSSSLALKQIIQQLVIYNSVVAIFFLPVLSFFYAHSALDDMVYCTFTWILENYKLDLALPYFMEERPIILAPLSNFSLGALITSLKEVFVGYFQLIGFGLSLGYVFFNTLIKKEYTKGPTRYILLFTLLGGGVFIASLTNPRDWQIRTMSLVGYMLIAFYISRVSRLNSNKSRFYIPNILKIGVAVMVFAFLSIDLFYDNINRSLRLFRHNPKLQTSRGTITADRYTLSSLTRIQDIINLYTQPGENIFIFYHQPVFYFFFNRYNPTHFNTVEFYYTPEQIDTIIQGLAAGKPKIVLRDNFIERRGKEIKFSTFFTLEQMLNNPVEKYVKQNYRLIENTGNIKIFLRKDVPPANSH